MKEVKQINVILSCPSDVNEELQSVEDIIKEYNHSAGKTNNVNLNLIFWKTYVYNAEASDPQEIINSQYKDNYDLIVAIFWQKIGSQTPREKSGTIEEIKRAQNDGKELLLYFNVSLPNSQNDLNLTELQNLKDLKNEIKGKVLFKEYTILRDFETLFRADLNNLIHDKFIAKNDDNHVNLQIENNGVLVNAEYSKIEKLIKRVEYAKSLPVIDEIEVNKMASELETCSYALTNTLLELADITKQLGEDTSKRTIEFGKITKIRDTRLRDNKIKNSFKGLSEELNSFSQTTNQLIPAYAINLDKFIELFSRLMYASIGYETSEIDNFNNEAIKLRSTMIYALNQEASLLETIMSIPSSKFQFFNESKNLAIYAINDLIKEMYSGLKSFDISISSSDKLFDKKSGETL